MRESNVSLVGVMIEQGIRRDNKAGKKNERFLDAMRSISDNGIKNTCKKQEGLESCDINESQMPSEKTNKDDGDVRVRNKIIRSIRKAVEKYSFDDLDADSDGLVHESELIRLLWPDGNLWEHFSPHCDGSSEDKQQMEGEMVWDIYLQYCNYKEGGLKKIDYESFVVDIKQGSVKFKRIWNVLFWLLSKPKPYYSSQRLVVSSFVSIYSDPDKTDQIRKVLIDRPGRAAADGVRTMIIKQLEMVLVDIRSFAKRLEIFYMNGGIDARQTEYLRGQAEEMCLSIQDLIALITRKKKMDSDFIQLCQDRFKEFKGKFYKVVSAANIQEIQLL